MNTLVILAHGQSGQATEGEARVRDALEAAGHAVWVTPHLYYLPLDDPLWHRLAAHDGPIAVFAWMHPRPIEWLFQARGIKPEKLTLATNWSTVTTPEEALDLLTQHGLQPSGQPTEETTHPVEPRWYPVVDRDRCTNCRSCFQFCLFGVYTVDDQGTVHTSHEDNCKTGCPACSRICPEGAIMFPMYTGEEAVAGAPGTTIKFDANAKRMFYMRTGNLCPKCDQSGPFRITLESRKAPTCEECGRPLTATKQTSPIHDEIDQLIGRLDVIAKRER